ncbi:hypothetical protein PMX22_11655 [Clostridium butyricum]|uniref:hypothetical protein n=1 Tax=Clostridium butyricum TaxID=1492 RepID=UPI00232B719D|nr:hypothetical protein [Clostridium butyricum]MDB2160461.1 hypothetical protein [Clostridium butyricum]
MNKSENEYIEFRYKGRKFNLIEKEMNSYLSALRFNFPNESYLYLNRNLSERKKQSTVHRLITGRGLSKIQIESKECNNNE